MSACWVCVCCECLVAPTPAAAAACHGGLQARQALSSPSGASAHPAPSILGAPARLTTQLWLCRDATDWVGLEMGNKVELLSLMATIVVQVRRCGDAGTPARRRPGASLHHPETAREWGLGQRT